MTFTLLICRAEMNSNCFHACICTFQNFMKKYTVESVVVRVNQRKLAHSVNFFTL